MGLVSVLINVTRGPVSFTVLSISRRVKHHNLFLSMILHVLSVGLSLIPMNIP